MSAPLPDPIADEIIRERMAWRAYKRCILARIKALRASSRGDKTPVVREPDAESTRLFNEWRDARLIRDALL